MVGSGLVSGVGSGVVTGVCGLLVVVPDVEPEDGLDAGFVFVSADALLEAFADFDSVVFAVLEASVLSELLVSAVFVFVALSFSEAVVFVSDALDSGSGVLVGVGVAVSVGFIETDGFFVSFVSVRDVVVVATDSVLTVSLCVLLLPQAVMAADMHNARPIAVIFLNFMLIHPFLYVLIFSICFHTFSRMVFQPCVR